MGTGREVRGDLACIPSREGRVRAIIVRNLPESGDAVRVR